MNNRLTHDPESMLRACQISKADIVCFVEGTENDIYFYSQISQPIFNNYNLESEFKTANELSLSGKTGGKELLIKFLKFLQTRKKLSGDFKGKIKTFVFFADKDVDDHKKKLIRSKHIIYTNNYDIQNDIVIHGNIVNSIAACISETVEKVAKSLGNQDTWLTNCIITWKEWVKICLFLSIHDISLAGYSVSSKINSKEYATIDNQLLDKYKESIRNKIQFDKHTFDELYSQVDSKVETLYASGHANQIFKGKWYLHWAVNHIKTKHSINLGYKDLARILVSNLDWEKKWTSAYRMKLTRVVRDHAKKATIN